MALDLKPSQNLPLTPLQLGWEENHLDSFWPVYPLTRDLFLENPFTVVGLI